MSSETRMLQHGILSFKYAKKILHALRFFGVVVDGDGTAVPVTSSLLIASSFKAGMFAIVQKDP